MNCSAEAETDKGAYEVHGMVATVTSYNNATPGSGTALNQCALTYNSVAQLTQEQQDHNGTVSGSSPKVQHSYDLGASGSNEIRLNGLTYPNSRTLTYRYGTSGGMNDLLNRVDTIQDTTSGTTSLASYTYLGLGTVIRITYPQPSVWLDLWGGTSGTFSGLDLFNRIIDQRWQNGITGTPADIDRYQYGYDRNSNRLYKANVVGTPIVSGGLDEYYTYDHLNRLTDMQRGTLNSGKTGVTGTPTVEQTWSLDPTGNWSGFVTKASGTTNLNQTRTNNIVNEITNITESTGPSLIVPAYDAAGNTTTMPQVTDPTLSFAAVYDAWNRMVKISSGGSTVATYAYDGRNRRIVKTTSAETRHFYFTNAWQDVEERVGTSTSMDKQYAWGIRYIDELVCRDDATPQRLYACQDANFNLTNITDTSGNVQERYLYDPYGIRAIMSASWAAISSSAYSWVIGMQGLMTDSETEFLYNRRRYRLIGLGVFGIRDPIGYVAGTNLYTGDLGILVSLDPSGLQASTQPSLKTIPVPVGPGMWTNDDFVQHFMDGNHTWGNTTYGAGGQVSTTIYQLQCPPNPPQGCQTAVNKFNSDAAQWENNVQQWYQQTALLNYFDPDLWSNLTDLMYGNSSINELNQRIHMDELLKNVITACSAGDTDPHQKRINNDIARQQKNFPPS